MHIHAGMHQEHSDTNNTAADDDADTPPSSSVPLSTSSRAEEATMPVDSTDNVHSAVQAPQDYNKPVASTRDEVASSITPDEPAKVASTREEANHVPDADISVSTGSDTERATATAAASTASHTGIAEHASATLADVASQEDASPEEASTSRPNADEAPQTSSSNEQEWPLKTILWPPFVDHPREVQILMQDVNGPCSFLALCNVLLLRGDIHLPSGQKTASFSQLSAQVGDYLLRTTNTASPTSTSPSEETSIPPNSKLDFAFNTLPKTLSGLDVNVNFITGGFSRSQDTAPIASQYSELELFKLANVDFKHGWIISEDDDKEVFEVFVTVANDYDTAVNVLVEGDAIAEGNITGNTTSLPTPVAVTESGATIEQRESESAVSPTISSLTQAQKLEQLFENLSMEPNKQAKVYQATIIQRFLQNTSTQLTYAGLFRLSEELKPDSLCALFRNSHFSVLYRRPNDLNESIHETDHTTNVPTNGNAQGKKNILPQATLFQLVTDQALLHEPNAIWESLEDIDGSASQFYDSRLQPARIRQDWVSRTHRDPRQMEENDQMHDADMALAAQLQQDEYDAEDQALQRRTQNNNRYGSQNAYSHTQAPRSDEQATVATQQQSSGGLGQSDSPSGPGGTRPENINPKVLAGLGARTPKKQKEKSSEGKKSKKDCIIC